MSLQPGIVETDEEFCRRHFHGETFKCRRCKTAEVHWLGVCDQCAAELDREVEEQNRPRTASEALVVAGVPRGMLEWSWKGCAIPEGMHLGKLRSWDGDPPLLTIWGPTGTGKTGAALCLLKDWSLNGKRVQWLYVPDWLDELRWAEREGGTMNQVRSVTGFAGLVVLDELVTRRLTDYGIDRVLQVLDARIREHLPTIATTNLRPDKGGLDGVDERIASRVMGGKQARWFGPDRRRK